MNRLIYHIASGEVFFTGAGLLLLAAFVSASNRRVISRIAPLLVSLGIIAIAISSTPLGLWFYVPAAILVAYWLVISASNYASLSRRRIAAALIAIVAIIGAALELPHHLSPAIDPKTVTAITIFGDSLAAGVGNDADRTWPAILARESSIPVSDHSRMGETTASALRTASQVEIVDGVVLVEIGGNDLLGTTSAGQFAADLDALLSHLSAPGRQIVLFELPLPPFANAFGRAQRQLASKYGAVLLPKRILASVLAGPDATLDSIHLSPTGHRELAFQMEKILGLLAGKESR